MIEFVHYGRASFYYNDNTRSLKVKLVNVKMEHEAISLLWRYIFEGYEFIAILPVDLTAR